MATTTLRVPEVHCDHCVVSIEGALQPLAGVEDVRVDLDDTFVTVTYDPSRASLGQVISTIEDQGYDVAS